MQIVAPGTPQILDTLAAAYATERNFPVAIEIRRRILTLEPSNALYRLALAKLYIETGAKAAARVELETLVKLGPVNNCRLTLPSQNCESQGDDEKAAQR